MLQTLACCISMWTALQVRSFLRSLPSPASLACDHCGLNIDVRGVDGTSSFACEIDIALLNSSPCRHFLVLTDAGKLSISCVPSPSDARESRLDFGAHASTSCIGGSSHDDHA